MRVLMVGNFSRDAQFSMLGFVHALGTGLENTGITVNRIAATPVLSKSARSVQGGTGKWLAYLDKYLLFPRHLVKAAREADLVHVCDQGNGIYMGYLRDRPHLLTCHDLLAMRAAQGDPALWPVSRTGQIYQRLIWRGIRQARFIACISRATQNDLERLLAKDPAVTLESQPEIRCIPHSLFSTFAPIPEPERKEALKKADINTEVPFLLHVGGNQPYKNRPGLLAIFDALIRREDTPDKLNLVLAGKPITAEMQAFLDQNRLRQRVLERSGLDDNTLKALYSHAVALVFPSKIEGQGLPIIEAQACDCPVFTTGRPPMTEVGADAAVYFDPEKPEEAAQIIAQTLADQSQLRSMVERGRQNVKQHFTLERMVCDYRALYDTILGG